MLKSKNPFVYKKVELEDGIFLYMINIEIIDDELKLYFDKKLTKICEGNREIDLKDVKLKLTNFFISKKDSDLELGAVAELIIHFFISTLNFKQEFLYTNLEENSLKKGFDGYYTKLNEDWILESKSGSISTIGITHQGKISEAYTGIKNKIEGIDHKNNPWENAYKHASNSDVNTKKNIKEKLNQLSLDYNKNDFHKVDKFNLIPCSTIFLEDKWNCIDEVELIVKIKKSILKKEFNKIIIICINKKSLKHIIDYLKT